MSNRYASHFYSHRLHRYVIVCIRILHTAGIKAMSLANKPTKELVSFMKDNGFLFPVCAGTYEVFDEISLYEIINRLKMTVELMTAANEIRKNYKKICDLTISLLFSEDLTIKTDSMKNAYSSCHHKYVDTLMNPPVQLSYSRQQEAFEGDNYNLDGIHPVYNSETMTPSWKVDSLLCAAYFSIFYLKPDLELYRPCDNPRCGRYFLVKTTSTRNRFCSQECCNRVTQDRYRKRKREKEGL